MKRFVATIAASGLLITTLGTVALTQPVLAETELAVDIASAGTKKATVTWEDGTAIASAPFDEYWVTLGNNPSAGPKDQGQRKAEVAVGDPLIAAFNDLSANTTYYAKVYAIDWTETGPTIIPVTGHDPDTPLGMATGAYTPLTMNFSSLKVLSGKSLTISGTLSGASPPPGVRLLRDEYPQFGGAQLVKTVKVNDKGRWKYTVDSLTESTWFFAEHRAGPDSVGGWTARTLIEVRKRITAKVSPGLRVKAGTTVKFAGRIGGNPAFFDDGPKAPQACLQRRQDAKWRSLTCTSVNTSTGRYSLTFTPGSRSASGKYRVFSGMGPAYADSWSKVKKLVVR